MTSLLVEGADRASSVLHAQSLEEILRAVEPGVMLVPPWLMQNVIASDQGLGRTALSVSHCRIYLISRERLAKISDDQGLGLSEELPGAETLILLLRPEIDWLGARPREQVLAIYWRLLFHGRIAQEMRRKLGPAPGNRAAVETRIERIGRSAYNEARFVLQREHCVPPKAGDTDIYCEFAALYLELHHFRPDLLPVYFPVIENGSAVHEILTGDVDAETAMRQTRPAGAPDSQGDIPGASDDQAPAAPLAVVVSAPAPDTALLARADRAAAVGNVVRAAILRQLAISPAPGQELSSAAVGDIDLLVTRLTAALEIDESDTPKWRASLAQVLARSTDGWWNQEARLLYDLQKVCVNHEREIYSVGVIQWLVERCRRPLCRPQPNQRIVLICKSLRSALKRIPRVRIAHSQREELSHLLHDALHHVESRLREALRSAIAESLQAGDLVPLNAVEWVAENKLVEELLDGLNHRGFITLSSLRDAVSNNQIKFKDIPSPSRLVVGDPLFKINRRLSNSLDGVYHSGEFYLRLFQRVSSVLFATAIGRFITRTLLMPLAGAFIIIAGLDHTVLALTRVITRQKWMRWEPPEGLAEHLKSHTLPEFFIENWSFFALALALLGVINWPRFRHVVGSGFRILFRAMVVVFYHGPGWLLDRPAIKAFLDSRPVRLVLRYVAKPLMFAAVAWLVIPRHVEPRTRWSIVGGVFLLMNFLINNPAGRAVEQAVLHWLRALGTRVTNDILVNLFLGTLHFFRRLLEDFDRMLYAVDEWLRFRHGQPRSSLYVKATLGIFWFYIAYVSRFAVNLLVEPQVNPIKHFPVVTVSHKIILPQVVALSSALEQVGMAAGRAKTLATTIVFSIPGIFGFLAWELRSNWKLYRANRAKVLKPVMVGSHGESMARLLRPGFHSGTIPKIFAHLRKAHREEDPSAAKSAILKNHDAFEHVAEAVAHFIEREFLELLNEHPAWESSPLELAAVNLCPTRVTLDFACAALGEGSMRIFFEQRGGWILAGIDAPGWSARASAAQARFLGAALAGLYKLAGVDLVKEQLESAFAPQPVSFDLCGYDLTVWPDRNFDAPLVFKLNDETAPRPRQIELKRLVFSPLAIEWEAWVKIWEPKNCDSPDVTSALPLSFVLPREIAERAGTRSS